MTVPAHVRLRSLAATPVAAAALLVVAPAPAQAAPIAPARMTVSATVASTAPMSVRELQQRLRWAGMQPGAINGRMHAGTRRAILRLQAKFGLARVGVAGPQTRALLRRITARGYGIDPRCKGSGKHLCINKQLKLVRIMQDGRLIDSLDARFGAEGMSTREGSFRVYWKSRNHVSSIYKTPMPYALFFSGGQAVHYSADFAARGYRGASHGCVNLRAKGKAAWLYDWTPTGTRVIVHAR